MTMIRRLSLAFAFATLTLCSAPAVAGVDAQQRGLDLTLVRQINAFRTSHGLAPLRPSPALDAAALEHSREMARDGYFAHSSRDGLPFWRRIEQFYALRGYASWSVGENLAWAAPSLDSRSTLELWLGSRGHRANLLNPRWREVGVAAVHSAGVPQIFGGDAFTVVTADFGART